MKMRVSKERLAVCGLIREAFSGVRLEDGVGLTEARGMDDYADEQTLAKCHRQDEEDDWSKIPFEKLRQYSDTLSFFDAKGMRFHLPAFMIGELLHETSGPVFHLCFNDPFPEEQFAELSAAQRHAVRAYLWAMFDDPEHEFHRPMIEAALATHWAK